VKRIAILGSTGSIGTQALEIIKEFPDKFQAEILIANSNVDLLIKQAIEFQPNIIVVVDESKYQFVKKSIEKYPIKVFCGNDSISQVVAFDTVDIVLTATVGFSGLLPTIKAIEANKIIALANKETLVVAGELIYEKLKNSNSVILPVDSEHSAIFQCLVGEKYESIEKLILTASGGPFRGKNYDFLEDVTPEQALNHPNWKMGNKVTIDSASLMNKGLEVIEAFWLFEMPVEKIDVLIHPQSVIHSMVEFKDGSIKAQMGVPTMKIPIQYAFDFPCRSFSDRNKLSFSKYNNLTFEEPDIKIFRNLQIAYNCLKRGGNSACIMNAANEIAVDAFLKKKIKFTDISNLIELALEKIEYIEHPNLQNYLETDNITRIKTLEFIK
jgi:1-deoxy-D-xylulose-5-phosphate reductoisomerase